jgi:hypothetical protein
MSQVLSPLSFTNANRNTPTTVERKTFSIHEDTENILPQSPLEIPSSPFIEDVPSPTKVWSPTKQETPRSVQAKKYTSVPLTEDALRENEGLTRAFETEDSHGEAENHMSDRNIEQNLGDDTASTVAAPSGYAGMDDTCMSAFSAAPPLDMTVFAQMRQSPTRASPLSPTKASRQPHYNEEAPTPRQCGRMTPSSVRRHHPEDSSPSPTPRRPRSSPSGDTTNLILDFTEQFSAFDQSSSRTHSRNGRSSPRKQPSDLGSYALGRRTPSPRKHGLPPSTPSESRHLANLLDFDLPPAPTPRSVPSITARELESLKSNFLSQISSLRANLSGKEAEVSSLKNAVEDAERRVGEALEEIRDERGRREALEADKKDWEKRDKEMQSVLRNVKEEIIRVDREKDELLQKAFTTEQKLSESESRLAESESRITGLRAASSSTEGTTSETGTAASTDTAVEAAVTNVAKELHGLYRHKHEEKVKALKKSYEARWGRKIKELQMKVDEVSRENEDLKLGRDATMSDVIPGTLIPNKSSEREGPSNEEREATNQQLKDQASKLQILTTETTTLRTSNTALLSSLAHSRQEMAALVAATEELISLSQTPNDSHPAPEPSSRGSFSRSISGGLRPLGVGAGESRIGRGGFGVGGKSMMSNIERMGRGGAGR